MTIHTGSIDQKVAVLAAAPAEASRAARRLAAEQRSAHDHSDPRLSLEGNAAERERLIQATRDSAASIVAQQRATAEDARSYLARVLDAERPRITDYSRAQANWAQATMYLDQGRNLLQVLRESDLALTLAVEEFGPHWLRAHAPRTPDADPVERGVTQLQAAVMERLALVVDDPALSYVIRGNLDAGPAIAAATPWWRGLDSVAAGRTFDGLHAAAEARIAAQRRASQLTEAAPQTRQSA